MKLIDGKGNAPETLSNSFFKYLLFFNNHVYWEVEKKIYTINKTK